MSAIAGIVHFNDKPVVEGQINQMTAAMLARGPDGCSHWVHSNVALGHCMLRTTPEAMEEAQPLLSDDGNVVLVMDGRVDNWQELRQQLLARGAVLRSRADAELVLQAYAVWGEDFIAHVDGDFALVVCDRHSQTVLCIRDRIGNRPLHYYWHDGTLVFASCANALLLLPQVPNVPNRSVLAQYLAAQWFSSDETLWQGVMRLRPAERLRATPTGLQRQQYWQPDVHTRIRYPRLEGYQEHYRELFADIVRRMSRSQLAVACEVSGGLDSSSVFAMAQHLRRQRKLLAPGIEGYTLVFHDDAAADEVEYSRAVSEFWQQPLHEIAPSQPSLDWYRQQALATRVLPFYPNTSMSRALVERARNAGSCVMLSGTGGDEWLGGSRAYYADTLAAAEWRQLWQCLRHDAQHLGWRQSLSTLVIAGLLPQLPFAVRSRLRRLITRDSKWGVDRTAWLTAELRELLQAHKPQPPSSPQVTGRPGQRSQLNRITELEFQLGRELDESLYASHGLELRMPFWDVRMVEFALAIPEHVRLQGKVDRALHRQAMAGLLPRSVLERQDKADFMGCFHHYLPAMRQELTSNIPARRTAWIHADGARALYGMTTNPQHQGWPEWMLWILFGCDAIFS